MLFLLRYCYQVLRRHRLLVILTFVSAIAFACGTPQVDSPKENVVSTAPLLSEPFLQSPTDNSVRVVWFTEFPGSENVVNWGNNFTQTSAAKTTKLTHIREDQQSRVGKQTEDGQVYQQPVKRDIWRHEAEVTGLEKGRQTPYKVKSVKQDGSVAISEPYSLSPIPPNNKSLNILLTSDHQLKSMVAANLQKAKETVGDIDAVFIAGDLINIPDRGSEWFDDNRGGAFFKCLQGKANYQIEHNGTKTAYNGAAIIQNAPLYTAIGNHEVMGRRGQANSLGGEFNDPIPRDVARKLYGEESKDDSFNSDTYEEIFTLPQSPEGGEKYYATSFGNIRLVVLYATNIWRTPSLKDDSKGKYREPRAEYENPENWGYGQHIFEPITPDSKQYQWLTKELNSNEFKQAKYKIVMLHHPLHSLGDNIVPAYTDPRQIIERDANNKITSVRYEYPKNADYLIRDIEPLLTKAGVQLVYYGHSHIWNRFQNQQGVNFLESSNVGNTYGAYIGDKKRPTPDTSSNKSSDKYKKEYVQTGDPNGLEAIVPTISPLTDENNKPLPYITSKEITVFSILNTETGTVNSYRFDTRQPTSKAVKFDEFKLIEK